MSNDDIHTLDPDQAGSNNRDEHTENAAAQRALAEAELRRSARQRCATTAEIAGRGGLDPIRYGDWEVKGLASDF